MRVFVVRHGQSQHNLENKDSGWSSSPLSEKGHAQAVAVAPVFEGMKFDRVFSSDLLRAVQTARHILPDYEPELSEKLREISVGSNSGFYRPALAEKYGEMYPAAVARHDYTPFGGENDDMVYERVSSFMKFLETLEGCENVAVFGHEGTVHAMVNYVLKTRFELKCLRVPNCSVTVLLFKNDRWKLEKFGWTQSLS
ncbi:MAG: histidine phosphatase family protein [Spirochaetales bacterium]|nr:histidine phosphatase family protein [Spirochaetales bacterium]